MLGAIGVTRDEAAYFLLLSTKKAGFHKAYIFRSSFYKGGVSVATSVYALLKFRRLASAQSLLARAED